MKNICYNILCNKLYTNRIILLLLSLLTAKILPYILPSTLIMVDEVHQTNAGLNLRGTEF